ncbi:hypothetical protein D3C79_971440 [compost metagenome]
MRWQVAGDLFCMADGRSEEHHAFAVFGKCHHLVNNSLSLGVAVECLGYRCICELSAAVSFQFTGIIVLVSLADNWFG